MSVTSIVTGAGWSNESAISAATPTASVARARVTQSAGPSRSDAVAGEAARQCRIRDHSAGDSDDPTGAAEADGPREGGEQQRLGDQPGHRAGLNRSHRSSVFVGTWGSTGNTVVRFSRAGGKVRPKIVNCVRVEQP